MTKMKPVAIDAHISVGTQPDEDDLAALARDGVTMIVNVREAGEADQSMSPEDEGVKVRELGLAYRHIPMSMSSPDPARIDELRAAIAEAEGPVHVHCGGARRACALVLAARHGDDATPEDLHARAKAAGFPLADDNLAKMLDALTGSRKG